VKYFIYIPFGGTFNRHGGVIGSSHVGMVQSKAQNLTGASAGDMNLKSVDMYTSEH